MGPIDLDGVEQAGHEREAVFQPHAARDGLAPAAIAPAARPDKDVTRAHASGLCTRRATPGAGPPIAAIRFRHDDSGGLERGARLVPDEGGGGLPSLSGCPLYREATQAVFGEGPAGARVMLVGEQPGDEEDRRGHPFVGPGAVLAEVLAEVGLAREELYLTNAVKHFKFVERGPRRLHEKPNARERAACRPWLLAELRLVRPRVVAALGATAAASLLGPSVRVLRDRGKVRPLVLPAPDRDDGSDEGAAVDALVTIHPSAILRGPTPERRRELRAWLVRDLRLVAERGR